MFHWVFEDGIEESRNWQTLGDPSTGVMYPGRITTGCGQFGMLSPVAAFSTRT